MFFNQIKALTVLYKFLSHYSHISHSHLTSLGHLQLIYIQGSINIIDMYNY